MGAPATPPPEPEALRLYYRDDRNVSIPFAWMSHDRQLIALDEGDLLVRAPQTKTRKRKDAAVLRIGKDLFGRMIGWWLHCMNINNERAGADFHRLLGLEPPSSTKTNTIVNWGDSQPEEQSEFVRQIR